jgi:hypothetical protein
MMKNANFAKKNRFFLQAKQKFMSADGNKNES